MRKFHILILAHLFLSIPVLAGDTPSCGNKPNIFTSVVSNAKSVWTKCINDFYVEQKKIKDQELAAIAASIQEIKTHLREVAYDFKPESNTVRCTASRGEVPSAEKSEKCRELVEAQSFLITRMDVLNGWDAKRSTASSASQAVAPGDSSASSPAEASSKLPCPKGDDYEKYKTFRYFKRNLYKTWEQCEILSQ